MRVCGKNVFNETDIKTIRRVMISKNFHDQEIMQKIRDNKIKFVETDQRDLDRMLPHNQGIVFDINDYEYYELSSIEDNENTVVILDHLEDPHNFGAIIRTSIFLSNNLNFVSLSISLVNFVTILACLPLKL